MVGKSARFLAPVALAAVAVSIYLLVHSALAKHDVVASRTSSTVVHTSGTTHRPRRQARFYVVRSGDTLSGISGRTHVSLDQLLSLNPSLGGATNSLQVGQRLRLRR